MATLRQYEQDVTLDQIVIPDEPFRAGLFVAPAPGDGWGVSVFSYPHTLWVRGFDSAHEAYWFAVQVCHVDPLSNRPDMFRRPPEPEADTDTDQVQMSLFA